MKLLLLILPFILTSCTFTAGYVSPNTGITYGLSHEFKKPNGDDRYFPSPEAAERFHARMRADAKTIKPIR